MRKTIIAAVILLAAIPAKAQEITYALPKTSINIEVGYTQEIIHAGKYAKYAKELLGIEVTQSDTVVTTITQFRIKPRVEADQSKRFTLNLTSNALPSLLALTDQGLIAGKEAEDSKATHQGRSVNYRKPEPKPEAPKPLEPTYEQQIVPGLDSLGNTIYDTIIVEIPPADPLLQEATDAAEDIKELREQRYKIITGDTDASYSGEALGAALQELSRLEAELLPLFEGTSETIKNKAWFDIIPDREGSFAAFALDPERGPVRATKSSTDIFEIIIEAEPVAVAVPDVQADNSRGKKNSHQNLVYRIPAVCTVTLKDGVQEITSMRMPIYQLGQEATYPVYE